MILGELVLTEGPRVCGTGIDYCEAPDCQFEYGPACDANTVPPGASTSGIARPHLGSVPYGTRINECTEPGVIALTFDDGPYIYTNDLLDLLDKYNAKVTFFISEFFMLTAISSLLTLS
jgi:hypothetical protein